MNERKAFKMFAVSGFFFFFFQRKGQRRELCEEQEDCRQALIRLPGQLVSWKPCVNSDGAFFFFWRVEIKCRWQRGGGEGLSCEDGES